MLVIILCVHNLLIANNFNMIIFLGLLPHKLKLIIPGNHEIALDPRFCGRTNSLVCTAV